MIARLLLRLVRLRWTRFERRIEPHRYSALELRLMRETGELEWMARWPAWMMGWSEEETEAYVSRVRRDA